MSKTFHHVGITVSDIERSAEFYQLLGFVRDTESPADIDTPWIKTMTGLSNAHLKIQNLSQGSIILELLQYISPPGTNQARMPTNNPGSAHVAVGVDDIFAEYARLTKAGIRFRSKPIVIPRGMQFEGIKAVYGDDPDGYTFELLELPK